MPENTLGGLLIIISDLEQELAYPLSLKGFIWIHASFFKGILFHFHGLLCTVDPTQGPIGA